VELHGQQDDRGLLNPSAHLDLLDQFGGHRSTLESVRRAWQDLREVKGALERAEAALKAAAEDADFLEHAVAELTKFAPLEGEDEALDKSRRLMQASEKIREDVAKAGHALGNDGAQGKASDALRWLEDASAASEGRLAGPLGALERALSELAEAERGVEDALRELDFNPVDLEQTEERLFALRALARKHNVQPDALPGLAIEFKARFEAIEAGDAHLAELRDAVVRAEAGFEGKASKLTDLRVKAARKLDKAMAMSFFR